MSESGAPVSRTLSWLLLIVLIGVYALYTWHEGVLRKELSAKDAELSQSAQRLSDAGTKLDASLKAEEELRGQMAALKQGHAAEIEALNGKVAAGENANAALREEMAAAKAQQAAALQAEQDKARQAYAQLEGRLGDANQKIGTLDQAVEKLKQEMAQAAEEHQQQLAEREQKLNEQIIHYRTALEGSDPERAAQMAGLQAQAKADREALDAVRQEADAKVAELTQRLDGAAETIGEKERILTASARELEASRTQLAQLQADLNALHAEYDAAKDSSADQLAAAAERLRNVQADLTKTKADAAAAMQQLLDTHAQELAKAESEIAALKEARKREAADAQGKIAALTGDLNTERAALTAMTAKHEATVSEMTARHEAGIADLDGKLAGAHQALTETKAQLAASVREAEAARRSFEEQLGQARERIGSLEGTVEELRRLYKRLAELGGRQTDQGMLLTLAETDLQFGGGKASLPDGELASLDRISKLLIDFPKLTARIEGHTDSSGSDESNLELSQARADAVKQALAERGVAAERMAAEGFGETRPIADNNNYNGRRANRRVEVYVVGD
jgi:outer membrane protein OmpA-like peptidoglycan-associated protein